MAKFFFSKLFVIFLLINFFHSETRYFPDEYIENDLIIPGDDKRDNYQYNLVDAKVLTKEKITLYIKKQGINLDVDDCCGGDDYDKFDAWENIAGIKTLSELQEILSNAKYNNNSNILSYQFPVSRIETEYYKVYHKLWVFDKNQGNENCEIYFSNNNHVDTTSLTTTLSGGKTFLILEMIFEYNTVTLKNEVKINCVTSCSSCASCTGGPIILDDDFYISNINFKFPSASYSPAISMHWTYYYINLTETDATKRPNFSLKGTGICSYSNPCVKGYACERGVCESCHASCFDCINGGLTTDCLSKCSPLSSQMLPNRGSCPLGYVDLVQFEDFRVEDIIPPCRNRRLTISFWFYITSLPDEDADPYIYITYDPENKFTFKFRKSYLTVDYHGVESDQLSSLNTWYFVKGGISGSHPIFLYIKYFDKSSKTFKTYPGSPPDFEGSGSGTVNLCHVYLEPIDYSEIYFANFTNLFNSEFDFKFYIKEFILFREYLPDPYYNKYFSYEKIFSSSFELPEVMFVIPFDEMIKNDDKYDIKCYSYDGSIIQSSFTITPCYDAEHYTLYAPKNFRPLNLLERNEKFATPDLVIKTQVARDPNTLIASYDNVPLTCIDNYFLTYEHPEGYDDTSYIGSCNLDCTENYSMLRGLSENKGFCNWKCSISASAPICLSNNYDLLNLKSSFKCKTGYYESYNNCEKSGEGEKNLVFYYDSYENPANIVIDVIHYNLKSYIIDFWMKPELDIERGQNLFYTNQFKIYFNGEKTQFYSFENRRNHDFNVRAKTWGHYSIEVYYDPKQPYNKKSTIYLQQNFIELEYKNGQGCAEYSENPLPLEYIYFCNGRKSSCNNLNIGWDAAYYKNLRLFDGNIAQRYILYRYDEYYSEYPFLLSSIKLYYPLYGHYIANNL